MSEAMVIPDGITPIVGWRAWRIDGKRLVSPTYPYVWPERAAAKAECRMQSMGFIRPTLFVRPQAGSQFDFSTGELKVSLGTRDKYGFPKGDGPSIVVSTAVEWPAAKDIYAHDACPSEHCSCGFYVTKSLEEAKQYGDVVGRVAIWGNVVEHGEGWRGQYAYPQAIYAEHPAVLKLKLVDYGVPVLPLSEIGGKGEPLATGGVIAAPDKPNWWIEPLRWIGLLVAALMLAFEFQTGVGSMVWGASGGTDLRFILGAAGGVGAGIVIAYWFAIARSMWQWRR